MPVLSTLLVLASLGSARAAEPEAMPDGAVDLNVVLADGSEASLALEGVQPCTWQRLTVFDDDGQSWHLDLRAEGREEGVLIEAQLKRSSDLLRIEAQPTVLVTPGEEAEVSMADAEGELYRLTRRTGAFPETCTQPVRERRERRERRVRSSD